MVSLRPCRADDVPALYDIALKTGLNGEDASHLFADGRLIGRFFAAPYAVVTGSIALVAEDELGVAGYAVGTADTCAWEATLERDWWPAVRGELAGAPDIAVSDVERMWRSLIAAPPRVPEAVAQSHPAHLHMNLLPRLQGRGAGSALLDAWLVVAREQDAAAVHVGVSAKNARGLAFWTARGFAPVLEAGRAVWLGRTIGQR